MARPHVPKFGNWENGENIPYTDYFDKAREKKSTGKIINPNEPQEKPQLIDKNAPQPQPKSPPSKPVKGPEEPVIRGTMRPPHEHRKAKENGEHKQFSDSPGRTHENRRRSSHGGGHERPISSRPTRQSHGNEQSWENSPLHPHHQAKIAPKVRNASPSWDEKISYENTPERPKSSRPTRQSYGNEQSWEKSPLRSQYQAKLAPKVRSSWDGSSYENTHGTPDRTRIGTPNRGRHTPERVAAVPKFGEWNAKNPSSADGYTHIFNKVREERHTGSAKSPNKVYEPSSSYTPRRKYYHDDDDMKPCCFPWGKKR